MSCVLLIIVQAPLCISHSLSMSWMEEKRLIRKGLLDLLATQLNLSLCVEIVQLFLNHTQPGLTFWSYSDVSNKNLGVDIPLPLHDCVQMSSQLQRFYFRILLKLLTSIQFIWIRRNAWNKGNFFPLLRNFRWTNQMRMISGIPIVCRFILSFIMPVVFLAKSDQFQTETFPCQRTNPGKHLST